MKAIELSARQLEIIELVKRHAPITGEQIAEQLRLSRPTIRSDLAVLVMLGLIDAKPKVGYFPVKSAPEEWGSRKLLELRVEDVQGIPVVIRESATVNDAVVTLFMENVGSLIVVDEAGMLAGIISRKDLLKVALGNAQASSLPVSLAMTRRPNVITVSPDEAVLDAARKLIHHDVDSLPVVVPSGEQPEAVEPVGRITKTTITKVLIDLAAVPMDRSGTKHG